MNRALLLGPVRCALLLGGAATFAMVGCKSAEPAQDDAGTDASADAGAVDVDGGMDGGAAESDAGMDAGMDAGVRDAGYRDPAITEACIACHAPEGAAWTGHVTTHRLLLYCTTCHAPLAVDAGVGHTTTRPCSTCHSTRSHPRGDASCTTCHDPHGTANVFLVRENVEAPDGGTYPIHFTRLEGASEDGLVHAGVADASVGTGLCEVCHTRTTHYTRTGSTIVHFPTPCSDCHSHELGFDRPDGG